MKILLLSELSSQPRRAEAAGFTQDTAAGARGRCAPPLFRPIASLGSRAPTPRPDQEDTELPSKHPAVVTPVPHSRRDTRSRIDSSIGPTSGGRPATPGPHPRALGLDPRRARPQRRPQQRLGGEPRGLPAVGTGGAGVSGPSARRTRTVRHTGIPFRARRSPAVCRPERRCRGRRPVRGSRSRTRPVRHKHGASARWPGRCL